MGGGTLFNVNCSLIVLRRYITKTLYKGPHNIHIIYRSILQEETQGMNKSS